MEAKAHNDITNKYAEEIKKAKHEGHIKRLLAKARSKGHIGKHIQVHNISTIPNGNIRYSIGLYRAPYNLPATNTNTGTTVENVVKDVAPDPNPASAPATTPSPPVGNTTPPTPALSQADASVEEFLEHHGIKGMHWGRKSGAKSGHSTEPSYSKAEAKAHNDTTDHLARRIKDAKHEGHMEHIIDHAYLNGHVEGNMKIHNVSVTPKGKISYELSLHRVTAGKPSTHTGDGGKREHIIKEVNRDPRPGMSVIDRPELFQHGVLDGELVGEFLEHHGVKGMKWGQRRFGRGRSGSGRSGRSGRSRSSGPVKMGVKPAWHSPPMKKIMAAPAPSSTGHAGKKHGKYLSEDAQQIHELRLKVKKHGVASLTNKDLEIINKRVELHQKYIKAHPKKPSKLALAGKAAVAVGLSQVGQRKIVNSIANPHLANHIHDALKIAAPSHGLEGLIKKSLK